MSVSESSCTPFTLKRITAHVFRYPIATPVRTSFGVMHDRPAVFVHVQDEEGNSGWGEIWCNFPSCGAEHRARLLDTVMAPLLVDKTFDGPAHAWQTLTDQTAVLAIQSGEHGPIAQTIAGIDLALWDLSARRAAEPLWRHLGGNRDRVPVYASGINPDQPVATALRCRDEGYQAFKLKIGFGQQRDLANLHAMREALGEDADLMVDANQAWQLPEAERITPLLERYRLRWLEEPLRADRPWSEWQQLKRHSPTALAGGENIVGLPAFEEALEAQVFSVLQPDVAKWGGISGCMPVIRRAQQAGVCYCPHYLGAGIGLLASAHLLAAVGGDGLLEVDANDNPLRTRVAQPLGNIDDVGYIALGSEPGIGTIPDIGDISEWIRAASK